MSEAQDARITALEKEVAYLHQVLRFVERWTVYKRYKIDTRYNLTDKEALSIIAFAPAIRAITEQMEAVDTAAYQRDVEALRTWALRLPANTTQDPPS